MKKIHVALITIFLLTGITLLTISESNKSAPGDSLYSIDRWAENIRLNTSKRLNPLRYAELNLELASERLQEIKTIYSPTVAFMNIKVHAQETTVNQELVELIDDFNQNISEAQTVLTTLEGDDKTSLSLLISEKTTEFGDEIIDISEDLTEEEILEFEDTISLLEDIDEDATEELLNKNESEDSETQLKAEVRLALQNKQETYLLKQRESLRILSTYFNNHSSEIKEEDATLVREMLNQSGDLLATAESQLAVGEISAVAETLDDNADLLGEIRDLITPENGVNPFDKLGLENSEENSNENRNENSEQESEDELENEDETEREQEMEQEKEQEQNKNPEPTEKPEPTERPEPSESPEAEEPEEEEESKEEDTLGVRSKRSIEKYDWLRNLLRF